MYEQSSSEQVVEFSLVDTVGPDDVHITHMDDVGASGVMVGQGPVVVRRHL